MVRKVFAVLGLLILAAATGVVVWQWPYFERWQSYPADSPVTNLAWYKPLENVFGRIRSKLPVAKSSPISSEIWQKIDDYAFRHNSSALLVSLAGKLIHERYWYGHEPHSLSNSMQMSHTIVALLIGVAIAEHSLGSLDDPLSRYLPEWKSDARGGITLRQLLGQRSGLRFDRRELDPYNDWRRLHFGADVAAAVLRLPLVSKPGADFAKNPANTQLLALVLERAT
ncbi:MAG: serine hydrolase, partial [Myxococcales bacterium]|nr:serine hydrolase [Myxococcales bacterium]